MFKSIITNTKFAFNHFNIDAYVNVCVKSKKSLKQNIRKLLSSVYFSCHKISIIYLY